MTDDELRDRLNKDPSLGIEIRLSHGMDEAEIWARAQAWAAAETARLEAKAVEGFQVVPVVPADLEAPAEPPEAPAEP